MKISGLNTLYNSKFFSIMPILALLVIAGQNFSPIGLGEVNLNNQNTPQSQEIINQEGVLRGNISVTKDLPAEFYGTWSVISVLVDTNNPELFRMRSSDIWTFERINDIITLSNPVSGASASITVTEVREKTAKFSRIKEDDNFIEVETPEITVEGDSFSGTDSIIIKHFRNGRIIKTDRVKYKVRGYKISGPTLKDLFAR